MFRTYKVSLSYDGSRYYGSQKQVDLPTIQGEVESKLKKIFHNIKNIVFAGRTDRGVHALNQVFSFQTSSNIPIENVRHLLKSFKFNGIRINQVDLVSNDFHARNSAKKRVYEYICTYDMLSPFYSNYISEIPKSIIINYETFLTFKNIIIGTHNFKYFMSSGSYSYTSVKTIFSFELSINTNHFSFFENNITTYSFKIIANGFLYHMVRNIMGCFFLICGNNNQIKIKDFKNDFIYNKNVLKFKPVCPNGLYLTEIIY